MKYKYNLPTVKTKRRDLRKNSTNAERALWNILKNKQILGSRFLRQYSVSKYILDFYCPSLRLAIEIDGGQHNNYEKKIKDKNRTIYLNKQDIQVLRFWNNEVLENIEGAYDTLIEACKKVSNPS